MNRDLGLQAGLLLAALTMAGGASAETLATGTDVSQNGNSPRVRVYDDISPLNSSADFLAFDAAFRGGVRVALGDVDGDGVPDRVVGAGPGGGPRVRVFSGTDNSVIADFLAFDANFTGGVTVAVGHVNADNRADIVVGSDSGTTARVRVFSGADVTQVLSDFFPFGQQQYNGGISVAAGDFNGNGHADVAVAPLTGQFSPVVVFFDGETGTQFSSLFPFGQQSITGFNLAAADINGDGRPDLVAAANSLTPRVIGISLATQQQQQQTLFDFLAFDANFGGGVRVAAGDLDGDGRADVVAGAGTGGGGRVRIFSGSDTSQTLADFFAYSANYQGGVFVAASELPLAVTGTIRFSSATYSQSESGPQATITVRRVNGSDGAASVDFAAQAGTAGAQDFTAVTGTLNWQDGDAADKTFQVPIVDDTLDESDETVLLSLSNAVGASLGQPATATLSILDDDLPPQLSFDAGSYQVNEAAGTLSFTVRRTGDVSAAASARISLASGTAQAGADFDATDILLNWAAGDGAARTVTIPIVDDALFEANETFSITLTVLSGATLAGPGTATATIVSDEGLAQAVFSQAEYSVGEADGSVVLTVRRTGETRTRVQLSYRSFSGSADAAEGGFDYGATSGVLVFDPGVTERTITVNILQDDIREGDERFSVLLENPSDGLTIPQFRGRVMILDDDQPPPTDGELFFGGSMNPLLLGPLLLLGLLCRRRRPGLRGLLAVAALIAAPACLAAPYYVGVRGGSIDVAFDSSQLSRNFQNSGYQLDADFGSTHDSNWGLLAGWQFDPRVALEVEFQDLGQFRADLNGDLSDGQGIAKTAAKNHAGTGKSLSLSLRLALPLTERLKLSPSAGLLGWNTETRLRTGAGEFKADDTSFGVITGLGIDYRLVRSLWVGVEGQVLRPGQDSEQRVVSGRAEWRFGN